MYKKLSQKKNRASKDNTETEQCLFSGALAIQQRETNYKLAKFYYPINNQK